MKNTPIISLACSILALIVSLFVLIKPNPVGKGIKAYDISTPEDALRSQIEIEINEDYLAAVQYKSNKNVDRAKEMKDTLEIHDSEDYDGKKILFVTYDEDGKRKHAIESYEKDSESGLWYRSYVSSYRMPDNSDMKKRLEEWESKDK